MDIIDEFDLLYEAYELLMDREVEVYKDCLWITEGDRDNAHYEPDLPLRLVHSNMDPEEGIWISTTKFSYDDFWVHAHRIHVDLRGLLKGAVGRRVLFPSEKETSFFAKIGKYPVPWLLGK